MIGCPINNPDDVKHGMIIDFSDLKKIVREEIVIPFDHATVLNYKSPHKLMADEMEERGNKIINRETHLLPRATNAKNIDTMDPITVTKTPNSIAIIPIC